MLENNLASFIKDICDRAGEAKGIVFHRPATWGMEVPRQWEAGYQLRRQGRSTVTLSYWFDTHSVLKQNIILPWAYPPTPEETETFKKDVGKSIDLMLKWL